MSRPARTIVTLDRQDAQRFARSLSQDGDRHLFFEEATSWFEIWRLIRQGTGTLVVFGARPPDKAAVRCLGPFVDTVVILQHAVNKRRSFGDLPLGYFARNAKKLLYWSLFIVLCRLLSPLGRSHTWDNIAHLFYFTSDYHEEWIGTLGEEQISARSCPRPDPTRFGTSQDIPVLDSPVAYQLIDEPFDTTLGITRPQEHKLYEAILGATLGHKIHVKLHPRSLADKYAFSDRFILSDALHSHANTVIGYRSGLLDYPFASPDRLMIVPAKGTFELRPTVMENIDERHETYLDCVTHALSAQGH